MLRNGYDLQPEERDAINVLLRGEEPDVELRLAIVAANTPTDVLQLAELEPMRGNANLGEVGPPE